MSAWGTDEANTIIAVTSIAAFLLSVASLYWQWSTRRHRIKVIGFTKWQKRDVIPDEFGGQLPGLRYEFNVRVYNTGERTVYIEGMYLVCNLFFRTRSLSYYWEHSDRFDGEIQPSRAKLCVVRDESVKQRLRDRRHIAWLPVRVCVVDEIGNKYRSWFFRPKIDFLGRLTGVQHAVDE